MNQIATIDVNTELKPFRDQLAEFHDRFDGLVYDLDDPKKRKQAGSDRMSVAKVVTALDARHKEIKAPLAEAVRLVDGGRKEIKDDLLGIRDGIADQIKAHDQKEEDRKNSILARVNEFRALMDELIDLDSKQLSERLEIAEAFTPDETLEEFKGWGDESKTQVLKALTERYAEVLKHETEQAELAELRAQKEAREQAERDEQIRQDAAEKAEREHKEALDKADRERQEAVERAEQQKKQAEIDAKAAAEKADKDAQEAAQLAIEKERERVEREKEIEADRIADERKAEEKRQANQKHRSKIHKAAKDSLIREGIEPDTATQIVELIKDGKIAYVEIRY